MEQFSVEALLKATDSGFVKTLKMRKMLLRLLKRNQIV